MFRKSAAFATIVGAAVGVAALAAQAPRPGTAAARSLSPAPEFMPDSTFSASAFPAGWQQIGDARWQAANGEITGTPSQPSGGWLLMSQPYQDVTFFSRFRCDGVCDTGVLLRAEKSAAGIRGIYVSLKEGDLNSYRLALDGSGKEISRELITNVTWGTIRIGAAPAAPAAPGGAAAGRGGGRGGEAAPAPAGRGGGGRGNAGPGDFRAGVKLPIPLAELEPPPYGLGKQPGGAWDQIQIIYDANIVRPHLNNTNQMGPSITDESNAYGPIALYVGGTSTVRFRDVSFKDVSVRTSTLEQASSRFRMQRLEEFSYAWGAAVGDFNRDGNLDVTAGPYIYLGPDFTKRREIYLGTVAGGYPQNMVTHVHDFTGDGWPDVLATEQRPMVLYVNPAGENRRWQRHAVIPQISSETTVMKDLDGDGRPEIIYAAQNAMSYAKYDPANPTAPWAVTKVSETGTGYGHSSGVGDINGDGRMDILQTAGWWEQPPAGSAQTTWTYHPVAFGRWGRSQSAGGGEIAVYDVNGDKLNDVVSALHGHGWGLAWFEQKRDASGEISFVRHMIMDNYSTANAGGVTFSQIHALVPADIDGDGIQDIVTGKRYWSHQDSYFDPDAYGDPVLYWYRAVRNPKAPGGAEFVPELIHNRSGVGSQLAAADLNKDGSVDFVTATNRGTFVFFGSRRGR